jgi:hypothetical protein
MKAKSKKRELIAPRGDKRHIRPTPRVASRSPMMSADHSPRTDAARPRRWLKLVRLIAATQGNAGEDHKTDCHACQTLIASLISSGQTIYQRASDMRRR